MDLYGWIQLALFLGLLLLVTRPMGVYLYRVLDPQGKTFLDPVLKPVERLLYRLMRVDPKAEQDWKRYAVSLLLFSLVGILFTYAILRLQHLLPLNPQRLGPVSEHLAFNTAVSFTTNTNWQSYGGESRRCPTSPRWSPSPSIISFPPPPASPWPRRSCGASPGTPPKRWATSGGPGPGDPVPAAPPVPPLRGLPGFPGDDPELQAV